MAKKIKLLIVIKNIDGGTGTFLFQLLKLQDIFDIKVCALERRKYGKTYFFKNISYCAKDVSYLTYYNLSPRLIFKILKEITWFTEIVKTERPDIILSIDTHCNLLSAIVGKIFFRTKVIITFHNNITKVAKRKTPSLTGALRFIGKHFFRGVDSIASSSRGIAEDLKRFFSLENKTTVIYYGLNFSEVKKRQSEVVPNKLRKIFNNKGRKILSIGRFEEQKDFDTLIKAFLLIRKRTKDIDLVLIGEGEQRKMLENLVQGLNLDDSVHFLGWQKNVYPFLHASDLFVLSSNYEGFGYVLLEAMSQGLPIISTDSPYGPSEVLDDGKYGKLVPVADKDKMASAIMGLLKNRKEYKKYSQKSLERIRHFTEEKMLNSYKNLILNLLR